MAFVRVSSLSQLPPESAMEVMVGRFPLALCRVGGTVRALWGICPHQGAPLGHGTINGENISCPWHCWEFNCATGQNDIDPDTGVPTYPVKIQGDDILVDVDFADAVEG